MIFYLFLLFIVLPLVEILILVKIGMVTSFWVPIAIVIVTGVVGTALARREGWKVLERMREDVRTESCEIIRPIGLFDFDPKCG